MNRLIVAIALAALTAAALLGCAGGSAEQPAAQQPVAGQPAAGASAGSLAALAAMRPEQKRSELASGFPVEVPVAAGTVVSARSQGPDAWDYELEVASDPATVRDWYAQAYQQRSWQVVNAGQLTQGAPGYFIEVRKNAAASRVDVLGSDGDDTSTVKVVVGLGAPVLETF